MRVRVFEIIPQECGGGVIISFRKGGSFAKVFERFKPKRVGNFIPIKESVNDREIRVPLHLGGGERLAREQSFQTLRRSFYIAGE